MKNIQETSNGLSKEQDLHRLEDCSAKGLCYISLKPLEADHVVIDGRPVNKQYSK